MPRQRRTRGDVTERHRLETQLVDNDGMVLLGVVARAIAHELRNPMSVASAAAQLLLDGPTDEQLRTEAAQIVHSSMLRASGIVENLLRFAPMDNHKEKTDVGALLRKTLRLLRPRMASVRVRLRTNVQPNLPALVVNRSLLQAAFGNLILHACASMPGGGVLTVSAGVGADGMVEIGFQDTGRGIPQERLDGPFRLFSEAGSPGDRTRVGLAMSYRIVQFHEGTIDVSRKVGRGSRFVVRLPSPRRRSVTENSDGGQREVNLSSRGRTWRAS
jgi:two-component system, sporulation sensor kinase E